MKNANVVRLRQLAAELEWAEQGAREDEGGTVGDAVTIRMARAVIDQRLGRWVRNTSGCDA